MRLEAFVPLGLFGLVLLSCGEGVAPPPPPPPAPPPQPATVTLEPNPALVVAGDTLRMTAHVLDQRARVLSGAPVTWTSGDPSVATVDATGLVTGLREGWASVTATSGPASATAPLTVRSPDLETLLDLYDATGGGGWTARDNWGPDGPVGDWYGVEANADGRVLALRLSNNGLRGQLPPNLGDLSLLNELRVDGNDLTGPLPISLSGLAIRELHYGGTTLCMPSDEAFRAWLAAIPSREGDDLACNEERQDLAVLYEALGGPSWENATNWLTDAPLETWHGIEVDEMGRVSRINLNKNGLSGDLPRRIARFPNLRRLQFDGNRLTGPILPEIGELAELRVLELDGNDFRGEIPPELGSLRRLERLELDDNRLVGVIPAEFGNLTELRVFRAHNNRLEGTIPSGFWGMAHLRELSLSRNRFEGRLPPESGALGALRFLGLDRNDFSGPLPAELGRLAQLDSLWLNDNRLSGPIPPEFGDLRRLRKLNLRNNPELSGPLPESLTSLRLREFFAGGTGLCAPDEPAFRSWLESILKRRVLHCGAGGRAEAYLTQAVQSRDYPVPLVAGEGALLRVFVTSGRETSALRPPVRATFFAGGAETHVAEIPAGSSPIPVEAREDALDLSANAEIPGEIIQPGLEMVVEIDPDGTLDASLGVTKRIPAEGRLPVEVGIPPTLFLTLVPFVSTEDGDRAAVAFVQEAVRDHEMFWPTHHLLPVAGLEIAKHASVTIDSRLGANVLDDVVRIRRIEGGAGHWMGLLPNPTDVSGVARRPGKVSFARLDPGTIAHELRPQLQPRACGLRESAVVGYELSLAGGADRRVGLRSALGRLAGGPGFDRPDELLPTQMDQRLPLHERAPLPTARPIRGAGVRAGASRAQTSRAGVETTSVLLVYERGERGREPGPGLPDRRAGVRRSRPVRTRCRSTGRRKQSRSR